MPYTEEIAQVMNVKKACEVMDLPRSHYYRYLRQKRGVKVTSVAKKARKRHPRALTENEVKEVLAVLHQTEYQDMSPRAVYATLLDDEKRYLCSVSTMYRLLAQAGETTPRGRQKASSQYQKPELLATGPNQLWSWDITKLRGPQKSTYYYLYVMLDVYSRYVVGWLIAPRESAAIAEEFVASCCFNQGITPDQLTIHADRGSAMTSKLVAQLMADLGITKTHSRPYTSNDNPYSEAHFKTLKYRHDFPEQFGSIEDARAWATLFFYWYNCHHRHTGLALMTPTMVHAGQSIQVTHQRKQVLQAAYQKHPERFVQGQPIPPVLPDAVWINPPSMAQAPSCEVDNRNLDSTVLH